MRPGAAPTRDDHGRPAPRPLGRRRAVAACPDLSALPPLLAATGSFGSLRERLGPRRRSLDRHGRHAGLTSVPHGAKSFLAATLALADATRAPGLGRARCRDRRPRRGGARRLARRPGCRRRARAEELRSPTSGASSSPTRRPPGSPRWRPGGRVAPGSSSPASRRSSNGRSTRPTCRRRRGCSRRDRGSVSTHSSASCSSSATSRRSRSPVGASSPTAAGSSTSSRRVTRCRSGSTSSVTRSTRSGGSTRPTSGPSARPTAPTLLPASEFLLPRGGAARSASAARPWRRPAARATRRRPRPVRGPDRRRGPAAGDRRTGPPGRSTPATRPRSGRRSSARRPASTTSLREPSSSSTSPATWPRPAAFLWRQADERRADLIAAADLPKDWPTTYLPPRDWKARLLGATNAGADLGVGARRGHRRRRPELGRPVRLARAERPRASAPGASSRPSSAGHRGRHADRPRIGPGGPPVRAPGRGRSAGRRGQSGRCCASARGRRPDRAQPQRRVHRRPRRPRLRHRSGAVRHGPRASAEGDAPGRPTRHPRTADAGRPRRPHRSRDRPLRADAPARRSPARSATTSSCGSRAAIGSTSRSSRSSGSAATRAASGRS